MGLLLHHSPPGSNPRRVFIALPSYGNPDGIALFSLFVAHPALLEAGIDAELCLLLGDCHVDDARNRLVFEFLKSSCDDLVFIDADIGFQAKDLVRLLSYDKDVVGGTYPKRGDLNEYPVMYVHGELWADEEGLLEVAGLPAGFLRIRRHVLEELAKDSAEYWVEDKSLDPTKQIFERLIVNGARYSSDYVFCKKWRDRGGKIYVDPRCYLEHRGPKIWAGMFGSHVRSMNGMSLAGLKQLRDRTEDDDTYMELMHEWGNQPYAAQPDFVKASVMVARQIDGPVLEMGSGLTTLAMAAANPGVTIHCLEHDAVWAAKLTAEAKRVGLTNIALHFCGLKDYDIGRWYDPPELPWKDFQLVLCDGPPKAGCNRNVLYQVMGKEGCRPRCILVDDAHRDGYQMPAGYRSEMKGQLRKFAVGLR